MLKIKKILFTQNGRRIDYDYSFSSNIAKYFNKNNPFYAKYDIDISNTPLSIAIIPFLANIIPIAWFAGFSVEVDEVDENFLKGLTNIKKEFEKSYPNIDFNLSKIHVKKIVTNSYKATNSAMLFSGGVDAYATYFRHSKVTLDLITIHGADVEIDDIEQWNRVVKLNKQEKLLKKNPKYYIESNLRTFYTHHVDLLLPSIGWWGKVQHGLALNTALAPLSIIRGYNYIYIASSYTKDIDISWGSTPNIDNSIKWGNTTIVHDGYELKRQEKIDLIVKKTKNTNNDFNLRVCYSLLNKSVNCSKCEKCYRTITGLILANANPNEYGFQASNDLYDDILEKFRNGFGSKGEQYFWWEILNKINNDEPMFIFNDKKDEIKKMLQLGALINNNIGKGLRKKSKFARIKFKIQKTFPKLFKYYLKIRQK